VYVSLNVGNWQVLQNIVVLVVAAGGLPDIAFVSCSVMQILCLRLLEPRMATFSVWFDLRSFCPARPEVRFVSTSFESLLTIFSTVFIHSSSEMTR
jgi:hypothetical protein